METYIGSEQTESFPQGGEIQNGDTGNHQDVSPARGVGHLNRFQGRLLPYTNTGTVQEISEISCPRSDIPIQSFTFQSVHSTLGVHCSSKGGKTHSQVPAPPLTMVAKGRQCPHRPTITPNKTCSANFYRHIKRRVGRSLKQTHCQRGLVTARKQAAYKLSGTKSSLSSFKRISRPLYRQDSTCGNRQHHSSVLHKQGRGHEVGPTLCTAMENLDLVYQTASNSQSLTHPRPAERGSRQAIQTIQTEWSLLPEVFQAICNRWQRPQIDLFATRFTSTGSPGHSSGCPKSAIGGSGRICLPTSSHLGQSSGEVAGLPMQENPSDCSGVAQHALVLGSNGHVQSNPTEPAQPVNTALQSDPSQKSDKPKSPSMAPRASAIKEQGFSEAVAARIEAPQRGSARSVYEAKWAIFTKCCLTHQVDFRAPPVKSVADFLMYLFQDRKLQPSTKGPLMVTGQPLLISWEIHPLISAKMKISRVSWIVSTEIDPKVGGESLPGTYPWSCTS